MELRLRLPRVTTMTAVINIYLLSSLLIVQVLASDRPPQLERSHSDQTDTASTHSQRTQSKRSLDFYDEDSYFEPSVHFQDKLTNGHKRPELHTQRFRPQVR